MASAAPDRDLLESRFPALRSKRWLLFLSRIDRKKGLDLLIDAWGTLAARFPDWHLVIAGSDLKGERNAFENQARQRGVGTAVSFVGSLQGELKACAMGKAELLVLPTRSENFGMAIAEALAHGLPVITTKAAPWSEIVSEQCGWWIDCSADQLEAALRAALVHSQERLREMGERGRRLVARKYSWPRVAGEMRAVYLWCLQRGERPDCVCLA